MVSGLISSCIGPLNDLIQVLQTDGRKAVSELRMKGACILLDGPRSINDRVVEVEKDTDISPKNWTVSSAKFV